MFYGIYDSETLEIIAVVPGYEEGVAAVQDFERNDRMYGRYEPNSYVIMIYQGE